MGSFWAPFASRNCKEDTSEAPRKPELYVSVFMVRSTKSQEESISSMQLTSGGSERASRAASLMRRLQLIPVFARPLGATRAKTS